jgi:hypothetical protein
LFGNSRTAEECVDFHIGHLTARQGIRFVPDEGQARRGVLSEEPSVAVRALIKDVWSLRASYSHEQARAVHVAHLRDIAVKSDRPGGLAALGKRPHLKGYDP